MRTIVSPLPSSFPQDLEEQGHQTVAQQYNELMVEARHMTAEVDALLRESEMDREEGGDGHISA